MAKFTGTLGLLALVFAIVDLVHGPHNGDGHRFYIHIAELISLLGFLCLLEIWAFYVAAKRFDVNRWLIVATLSLLSCVLGLVLFGLAGGSFHGDGGPIATSFLLLGVVGTTSLPISLVVFALGAILRKRQGMPIFGR